MFEVWIETDNAAFEEDLFVELARLLNEAANKVANGQLKGSLSDINGNKVGGFYWKLPEKVRNK